MEQGDEQQRLSNAALQEACSAPEDSEESSGSPVPGPGRSRREEGFQTRRRRRRPAWSRLEEAILAKQHSIRGNSWSAIAEHLPGRSASEVKNIWHSTLRSKKLRARSLLRAYARAISERGDSTQARLEAFRWAVKVTKGGSDDLPLGTGLEGGAGEGADYGEHLSAGSEGEDTDPLLAAGGPVHPDAVPPGSVGTDAEELIQKQRRKGPGGGGEISQDSQPESQQPSGADPGQAPRPRRRRTHIRNNRLTTQSADADDGSPPNAVDGVEAANAGLPHANPNPARYGFMGEDRGGPSNALALVEYMGAEVEDQPAKYLGSDVGDQAANCQVPEGIRRPYLPPRPQRPAPASFGASAAEAVHNTRRQTQLKQQRGQEQQMHQRPPKQPRRQEDDRGGDGGFGSRMPRNKEPPAPIDVGLEGQQALAQLQMLYLQAAIERRCAAAALEALPPAVIARRLLEEEAQAEAYRMLLRQRLMTRAQEYELEQLCGMGTGAEGCNADPLGRLPGEARGSEAPQDWQQGNKRGAPSQGPEQQAAQAAANGAAGAGRAPSQRNHLALPLGNMDPLSAAVAAANLAGAGNFGLGATGLGMAGLGAASLGAAGLGAAGLGAAGLGNLGLVLGNFGLGRAGLGGLGINALTGAPDLGLGILDQLNALLGPQRVGMDRLMADNPIAPGGAPLQSGRPPRGAGAQKRGWDGQQANATGAQGMDFDTRSRDGEPYEGYAQQEDKAPPHASKGRVKRRPDAREVDGPGSPYDAAKQGLPHSLAALLYGKGGDQLDAGLYGAGLPAWPLEGSIMDWAGASIATSLQRGRAGGHTADARARSAAAWNANAAGHASEDGDHYEAAGDDVAMPRQRGPAMGGRDMARYRRPGRNVETHQGYEGAQSDDDQYHGGGAPRQRGRSMGGPSRPRFWRAPAASYDVDAYEPEDGEPPEDGFYHRGMPVDVGGPWHRARVPGGAGAPRYRRAVREAEEADLEYEADDLTEEALAVRQRGRGLGGAAGFRQRPSAADAREHTGPEFEAGELLEEGCFQGRAGGGAAGARQRSHFVAGRSQRPIGAGLHEEGLPQEPDAKGNEAAAGDGDARRQRGHMNGGPRHRQMKQPYTEDRKQAEIEQDAGGSLEDRRYDGMADEEPGGRQLGRPSGSHASAARSRAAAAAAAQGKGETDFEQAGGAPPDDGLYQGMPGDGAALRLRGQAPGGGAAGSRFRPKPEPAGPENGDPDVPTEDGYPQGGGRMHDAAAAPRQHVRPPSGQGAARYRSSLPDADGAGLELEDGPPVDDAPYQDDGDAMPRRRGRGAAGRGGVRVRPPVVAKQQAHEGSGEGDEGAVGVGAQPQRRRGGACGPGNGYGGGRGSGGPGRGMSNAAYEQDGGWQQYRPQSQEGQPQSQQPSGDFERRDVFDADSAVGDVAHALLSISQHLPHSMLPGGMQPYPATNGAAAAGAGRRPSATGAR